MLIILLRWCLFSYFQINLHRFILACLPYKCLFYERLLPFPNLRTPLFSLVFPLVLNSIQTMSYPKNTFFYSKIFPRTYLFNSFSIQIALVIYLQHLIANAHILLQNSPQKRDYSRVSRLGEITWELMEQSPCQEDLSLNTPIRFSLILFVVHVSVSYNTSCQMRVRMIIFNTK